MLASTVQFSNNTQHQPHHRQTPTSTLTEISRYDLQQIICRYFLERNTHVFSQDPTVCRYIHSPTRHMRSDRNAKNACQRSTHELPPDHIRDRNSLCHHPSHLCADSDRRMLLRKEVIQPHLPVRLPCYDFVPIADPTFDGSLPQGVRPPASGVTDFHDVTGGVYKARERIHRSVADLRLLATPTSRGRVADPDPN